MYQMSSQGIYILANDLVFDQLVALVNSIEINVSETIPICIIPYDNRLDRVKSEIKSRANLTLFDNARSLERWDDFAKGVWSSHSRNNRSRMSRPRWYKSNLQRKFCSFDGDFDRFVFYDADSLAMKPLDEVFAKLNEYDFVFDDWEHKKSVSVAALNIPIIEESGLYSKEQIISKLHCGSFFSSKKDLFSSEELDVFKELLINQQEIEWISGHGWWDDVFLFNYMTLRCNRPLFNFTLSSNSQERTGNCADADPFININNVLYNEQGLKPIHRIHYMNYLSTDFTRLCRGEDVNICYKDVFLHYRFLKKPEQKPQQLKQASSFVKVNRKIDKVVNKLTRIMIN
jgi:acyl carrier protein phosphodiesterase